ncbi:DUF6221 family protein [Nocardia sp. NPDC059239]|uniref:DUF6221 family protein n=1 Tax=unclassified Nocardia TaxID=2637762 RepID=UPI0036B93BD1
MSDPITDFIEQRLAEDETIARGAIDPNRPGANWRWETTHTGTPVPDGEEAQALDDGHHLSLRTLEEFPLSWDPPSTLPAFIIGADGGFPGGLRHIARHDPARVLRQSAAMRLILVEHARTPGGRCSVCRDFDDRRNYDGAAYPCPTVRALTAIWSDHPDYRPEWDVDGGGSAV